MSLVGRFLAAVSTVFVFGLIALGGALRCSGDTDGCFPSWVNTALAIWGLTAGVYLVARALMGAPARSFTLEFLAACAIALAISYLG